MRAWFKQWFAGSPPPEVPTNELESLVAGIEQRWLNVELTLQHARRRIADLVVTRRTLGPDATPHTREALDDARVALQRAVDSAAVEVERTRARVAELRSRLHLADSRAALVALSEEMDAVSDRMRASLDTVASLVISHEAHASATEEVSELD